MERDEILREILSDPEIMGNYNLTEKKIKELSTKGPYFDKVVEVMSVIINENDNHLSSSMIYKKLKNIYKIV